MSSSKSPPHIKIHLPKKPRHPENFARRGVVKNAGLWAALALLPGCRSVFLPPLSNPPQNSPPPNYGGKFPPAPKNAGAQLASTPKNERQIKVLNAALQQLGKPYRWGGETPDEGFDCSGLVQFVFKEALQIDLPRTAVLISKQGQRVDFSDLQVADLIFFDTDRKLGHVSIHVGSGRFIHAPNRTSSVRFDSIDNAYWHARMRFAARIIF